MSDFYLKKYSDDYPTCRETYVTLRIYPKEISLSEVTRLLKVKPTEVIVKGAKKPRRRGSKTTSFYKMDGWFLCSEHKVESKDSRRHFDWILDRLVKRKKEFRKIQATCSVDICCLWDSQSGHGGPTISPVQARKIAQLNVMSGLMFTLFMLGEKEN